MQTMGTKLCIAKSCGERAIFGPFDMEVHQVDKNLYVINAARLMPPEYRRGKHPGSKEMYELLRPELLAMVGIPVVPDTLKGACGDA